MFPVGVRELIVAAVPAAGAGAAMFSVESEKARATSRPRARERGHVIQYRAPPVDRSRHVVLRIPPERGVLLSFHRRYRRSPDLEMRNRRAGAGLRGGVQCAKD